MQPATLLALLCSPVLCFPISLLLSLTHTHTLLCSRGEEVRWFQGVWEQIIHVYWPHRTRSKALLTGPEAAVHFGEVAMERFSGITRGRGQHFGASDKVELCVTVYTNYLRKKTCKEMHRNAHLLHSRCFWSFCTVHTHNTRK